MRRKSSVFAVIFLCFFSAFCIAGCGKEESPYFDIQSEETKFYDVAGANADVSVDFLNMQFYQDEPVQIWAIYDGAGSINVYLYRMDGSRELLLEKMPNEYVQGGGFLDQEGNYYYWAVNQGSVIKVDSEGRQIFNRQLSEAGVFKMKKLCQLKDGRIYARCAENGDGGADRLYEMDAATGELVRINNDISYLYIDTYVAAGEDGLLYLNDAGIQEVDVREAAQEDAWLFRGTSFALSFDQFCPVWDFRIREDGSLELLQAEDGVQNRGAGGVLKRLQKVAAGEGKKIVLLRGCSFTYDTWLKGCVRRFNEQSEEWYVVLEECTSGTDQAIQEEYARQTSVEMAAGKGPDILYENVLRDYAYGIFQKGGFAELDPYLEVSGMKKEDFFPCVFGYWQSGGKSYSVSAGISFWTIGYGSVLMDGEILGGNKEPDIAALVNALLARQEDGVFQHRMNSVGVLELLLKGTEDVWGMVNWEKGQCDLDTELFAGILETAKRYGMGGNSEAQPLTEQESYGMYRFLDSRLLEEQNKIKAGILFDDGCHANPCEERTLMINANSDKKDGAWEFILFLLEEGQPAGGETHRYPASKEAFDTMMKREMSRGLYTESYGSYDYYVREGYWHLTEERIAELKKVLEDARYAPVRTQPILDIIYQEAQASVYKGYKQD